MRLQKAMAAAGYGSRRGCEELIASGRVRVNGQVVRELPVLIVPGVDEVLVDGDALPGQGLAPARPIYVMLYKPRHTVTTLDDPSGRRTVVDLVAHPSGARLYPVGRLDYDTMGLLLLTNDGELANRLTHPRYGVHKTYRAIVKGVITDELHDRLHRGVLLTRRDDGETDGIARASAAIDIVKREPARTIIDLTLSEGRNRQVRRMLAKVGCPVKKLVRIRMGPLALKGVALGEWRELTTVEVHQLRRAVGLETAKGRSAVPGRSKSQKAPASGAARPPRSRRAGP